MQYPKVVIFGLDSATWDLMGPWIAKGILPNLAKLIEQGVSGHLESAIPPLTPPAWTSFMTGKNPGKHGIFNFLESQPGTYGMRYANASSRRSPTFFKLLSDNGFSVGSMNTPFTYPPEPLNGFQISGMDTPSEKSAFVYPATLREELESKVGKISFDVAHLGFMSTDERRQDVLSEMERADQQWAKLSSYLLERHTTDIMMFTFMSVDTVQHHFWQYMDPGHFMYDASKPGKFGDAIQRVYQRLDGIIGSLIARLPEETTVLVVSDHGGGPVSDRVVYLNRFLAQIGLLKYRQPDQALFSRLKRNGVRVAYRLLHRTLGPDQKRLLAGLLPGARERFEGAYTSYENIDWSATKAYCSEILASPPSIWINKKGEKPLGIVEPEDSEEVMKTILERLAELKDPRTGEPIIPRVYRREELFSGPFVKEAPELILDWWSGKSFSVKPSFAEDVDKPVLQIHSHGPAKEVEWGGTHRLEGILIMKGRELKKGQKVDGARLTDIAPTLLCLLGQKIPVDMDGRVVKEAFDPAFIESHPPQFESGGGKRSDDSQRPSYSPDEAALVEARLKALGYIE
jgi:predicted AlkP superfamily phosphohydrolase/phosphomutase